MTGPFALRHATLADGSAIHHLHERTLDTAWSEPAIRDLVDRPSTIAFVAEDDGTLAGFVLAQVVLDEAELLSIAVAPQHRRRGVAATLIDALLAHLRTVDVRRLFLEVAQDNRAAAALYARCGFTEFGRRKGYYVRPTGTAADAIMLVLPLASYQS